MWFYFLLYKTNNNTFKVKTIKRYGYLKYLITLTYMDDFMFVLLCLSRAYADFCVAPQHEWIEWPSLNSPLLCRVTVIYFFFYHTSSFIQKKCNNGTVSFVAILILSFIYFRGRDVSIIYFTSILNQLNSKMVKGKAVWLINYNHRSIPLLVDVQSQIVSPVEWSTLLSLKQILLKCSFSVNCVWNVEVHRIKLWLPLTSYRDLALFNLCFLSYFKENNLTLKPWLNVFLLILNQCNIL